MNEMTKGLQELSICYLVPRALHPPHRGHRCTSQEPLNFSPQEIPLQLGRQVEPQVHRVVVEQPLPLELRSERQSVARGVYGQWTPLCNIPLATALYELITNLFEA